VLLARFARSEPAAIEAERCRERGRLARIFLPVPESAVDPVRLRRRPEDKPSARPVVSGGRTVVRARPGAPVREPLPRKAPPRRGGPPLDGPTPPRERSAPSRNRRTGEEPPRSGGRRQSPAGAPRRPGGSR
jgi:cell division protein FtsW